jgi:metal-responsive CopG/Arc/MetJ family transcriptional regulator
MTKQSKAKPAFMSYAERKKNGRPTVTFSLPETTVDEIERIAERLKLNRSAVVDLAVRELGKRY